jgi:hypothetical protein
MEEKVDVEAQEITPEQFDGEQEAPKAESSPAEEVKEESKEETKTETPEAEKEEEKAEPEAKPDEAEKPEDKVEEKPLAKADERKAQLNTEIRDLVSQRNSLRDQVAKANAEVYQVATEDELVDQGMSALEAKVEAMRQETEVSKYNERVAEEQLRIGHESDRVLRDFPMFNPESSEYDQELGEEAATLLRANLILDPNTQQVIGSNVSPYQLYKTLARASGISAAKGQIQGQQDTQAMLASADTASSVAPAKVTKDPVLELWESDD